VNERVHAPHFFGGHPIGGVKVFNLARESGGQQGRIKFGDGANAAAAIDDVVPCLVNAIANGRQNTEARDYNASFTHDLSIGKHAGNKAKHKTKKERKWGRQIIVCVPNSWELLFV
jgi:hypothetical protein